MSAPDPGDNAALARVYTALINAGSVWSGPGSRDWTCPAHSDRRASLGVSAGDDHAVVLFCQAGCTPDEVIKALGLRWPDLFMQVRRTGQTQSNPAPVTRGESPERGRSSRLDAAKEHTKAASPGAQQADEAPKVVAAKTKYVYRDATGAELTAVYRTDFTDGTKDFAQSGNTKLYVLYRLPAVLAAAASGLDVLLVAGEKSVHAVLKHLGGKDGGASRMVVTTVRGGEIKRASQWRSDYTGALRGARKVIVVADRDKAGYTSALLIAAALREAEIPVEVRVSVTSGDKDDVVEHLAAGHELSDLKPVDDGWLRAELGVSGVDAPSAVDPWPSPAQPLEVAHTLIERFHTDAAGRRLRLLWRGDFYDWGRTHWTLVEPDDIRAETYERLRHAVYSVPDKAAAKDGSDAPWIDAPWNPDLSKLNRVFDALRGPCLLPASTPDGVAGVVSMTNGLLDLGSRDLSEHAPGHFSTVSLPFAFDPVARAPKRWLGFLRSIWGDDGESVALLQEIVGYLVSGRTDMQKIPMVIGPPRSGKGTIAHVIESLIGRANVASPTLTSLAGEFGRQPLIGKSVALISDARFSGGRDQGAVVELLLSISGEDSQSINRKNREAWQGRLTTRFVIMSNESPTLRENSGALAHRMLMLRMTRSFLGREDYSLAADLDAELPGIFAWALAGYDRLLAQGRFTVPGASRDIEREMLRLTSPVIAFVQDVCQLDAQSVTPKTDLWVEWKNWASANGVHEGASEWFGRNLINAFPSQVWTKQVRDKSQNGHRVWHYVGVRVRDHKE